MSEDFRQTITEQVVCEKTTCLLTLPLTDETGAILSSGVTACTLTLYDKRSGSVLNGRTASNINGANGGTVTAGIPSLVLSNLDNALSDQTRKREEHIALIEWTWSSGSRFGKKEVTYFVINQTKVT